MGLLLSIKRFTNIKFHNPKFNNFGKDTPKYTSILDSKSGVHFQRCRIVSSHGTFTPIWSHITKNEKKKWQKYKI